MVVYTRTETAIGDVLSTLALEVAEVDFSGNASHPAGLQQAKDSMHTGLNTQQQMLSNLCGTACSTCAAPSPTRLNWHLLRAVSVCPASLTHLNQTITVCIAPKVQHPIGCIPSLLLVINEVLPARESGTGEVLQIIRLIWVQAVLHLAWTQATAGAPVKA